MHRKVRMRIRNGLKKKNVSQGSARAIDKKCQTEAGEPNT